MTPILSTTGGGSVRGFGRRRPEPSGPSGPSGPPSNGSGTNNYVTSLTTSQMTLNWTNADAAANVYLYTDSVFVSDLGVNATSTTQGGVLNTQYTFELSAYKNGIESAKYNMGGPKTFAGVPNTFIFVPAGNVSPPTTWNNNDNTIYCYGPGEAGDGAAGRGGAAGSMGDRVNTTWSGAVAVVHGAARAYGDAPTVSSIATSPACTSVGGASGGQGGYASGTAGGGGGGDGEQGGNASGDTGGAGGGSQGGKGGDVGQVGASGFRGGGGGGGGEARNGGAGGTGGTYVIWGGGG